MPGAPGRVVTLIHRDESDFAHVSDHSCHIPEEDVVWGVCYQVAAEKVRETLEYLDYREKGGYSRSTVDVFEHPDDSTPLLRDVLLYTATTGNQNYLGPAPLSDIATQIFHSVGPSGPNMEYLFQLYHTLQKHNIIDFHIGELYKLVSQIAGTSTESTTESTEVVVSVPT